MNRFVVLIMFALTLAACSREGFPPDIPESDMVKVSFSIESDEPNTKAKVTVDDSKINSALLIAFKNKGKRVLYETSVDRAFPQMELPGNCTLDIFAIVNPSTDLSSVDTYDEMRTKHSVLQSKNSQSFEMISHIDTVLTKDSNVVLKINRVASKITLKSVRYRDYDCYNEAGHFMDAIYLIDMSDKCPYTFDNFVPSELLESPVNVLSYLNLSGANPKYYITGNKSYYYFTGPYSLYCYPNAGPIPTKLVLRVQGRNGQTEDVCSHYYTFSLPALLPNREYYVNELFIDNPLYGDSPGDTDYHLSSVINYDIEEIDSRSGAVLNRYRGKEEAYEEIF